MKRTKQTSQKGATVEKGDGESRINRVGVATSQIIEEAAALLDEEIASGIVAAKKMRDRFEKHHHIDEADFKDALHRFQADAHEVVSILREQFKKLSSQENSALADRFVKNTHDLVDLATGMVSTASKLANELLQKSRSNPRTNAGKKP